MEDGDLGCKLLLLLAAPSTLSLWRWFSRLGASLHVGCWATALMQKARLGSPSAGAPAPASAAMSCGQRGQGVGHGPSTGSSLASPPLFPPLPQTQNVRPKMPNPWLQPLQSSDWFRGWAHQH